ncbi:hypothetical protein ACFLQU_00745 [Verrucomicrobiota bacterium]
MIAAATPLQWDPADTGNSGGSGDWDLVTQYWEPLGGGAQRAWANGDEATFAGVAGTVTLTKNITASSISFGTSGYALASSSGSALTLGGGNNDTTVGPGMSARIDADLAGSIGIEKYGAGTLVLGGVNTFTGTINLRDGTSVVADSEALSSSGNQVVLWSGKTLAFRMDGNGSNQSIAGPDNKIRSSLGAHGILNIDVGPDTSANSNNTIVIGSGLDRRDNEMSDGFTLNVTGSNGYRLQFQGNMNHDFGNSLAFDTEADLIINGGWISASSRSCVKRGAGTLLINGIRLGGTATFAVNEGAVDLIGTAAGTGGLTKGGAGTRLHLRRAGSYSGSTTVTAGEISVHTNNALGTTAGKTFLANGGTIVFCNAGYLAPEDIDSTGSDPNSATYTIRNEGNNSRIGGNHRRGGTTIFDIAAGTTLTLTQDTEDNGIGNNTPIHVVGGGTLVLEGANNRAHVGTHEVRNGILLVNGLWRSRSGGDNNSWTVKDGGTIGGVGTIRLDDTNARLLIESGGALAPGAEDTGVFTVAENVEYNWGLRMNSGSRFEVEIMGTVPGEGGQGFHDQLRVTGWGTDINFNADDGPTGAALVVSMPVRGHLSGGNLFFIVDNQTGSAVSGRLSHDGQDLAQGAEVTTPEAAFTISYTGDVASNQFEGSGNDVVLRLDRLRGLGAVLVIH